MAWRDRAKGWLAELPELQERVAADTYGMFTEGLPFIAEEMVNLAGAGIEGLAAGLPSLQDFHAAETPGQLWDVATDWNPDRAAAAVRARQANPYTDFFPMPQTPGGIATVEMANWAEQPIEAVAQGAADLVFRATESPAAAAGTVALGQMIPLPGRTRGSGQPGLGDINAEMPPNRPPIYSRLERDLEDAPQRQRPDQWAKWLERGGHNMEANERGVLDWIGQQDPGVALDRRAIEDVMQNRFGLAPASETITDAGFGQKNIDEVVNQYITFNENEDGTLDIVGADGKVIGDLNYSDGLMFGTIDGDGVSFNVTDPTSQSEIRGRLAEELDQEGWDVRDRPRLGLAPLAGTQPRPSEGALAAPEPAGDPRPGLDAYPIRAVEEFESTQEGATPPGYTEPQVAHRTPEGFTFVRTWENSDHDYWVETPGHDWMHFVWNSEGPAGDNPGWMVFDDAGDILDYATFRGDLTQENALERLGPGNINQWLSRWAGMDPDTSAGRTYPGAEERVWFEDYTENGQTFQVGGLTPFQDGIFPAIPFEGPDGTQYRAQILADDIEPSVDIQRWDGDNWVLEQVGESLHADNYEGAPPWGSAEGAQGYDYDELAASIGFPSVDAFIQRESNVPAGAITTGTRPVEGHPGWSMSQMEHDGDAWHIDVTEPDGTGLRFEIVDEGRDTRLTLLSRNPDTGGWRWNSDTRVRDIHPSPFNAEDEFSLPNNAIQELLEEDIVAHAEAAAEDMPAPAAALPGPVNQRPWNTTTTGGTQYDRGEMVTTPGGDPRERVYYNVDGDEYFFDIEYERENVDGEIQVNPVVYEFDGDGDFVESYPAFEYGIDEAGYSRPDDWTLPNVDLIVENLRNQFEGAAPGGVFGETDNNSYRIEGDEATPPGFPDPWPADRFEGGINVFSDPDYVTLMGLDTGGMVIDTPAGLFGFEVFRPSEHGMEGEPDIVVREYTQPDDDDNPTESDIIDNINIDAEELATVGAQTLIREYVFDRYNLRNNPRGEVPAHIAEHVRRARENQPQPQTGRLAWDQPTEPRRHGPQHENYATNVQQGYMERALRQPGDTFASDNIHMSAYGINEGMLSMSREGWGSPIEGGGSMWLADEVQSPRYKRGTQRDSQGRRTGLWWDDPLSPVQQALLDIQGPLPRDSTSASDAQILARGLESLENRIPPTPMRKQGKWIEHHLARSLSDAVARNADYFGWNTADEMKSRWGTSGALFDKIYDQVAVKSKIFKRLGLKPEKRKAQDGKTYWTIELTPAVKDKLRQSGIPYYVVGGAAVLGAAGEEDEQSYGVLRN